LPRHNTRSVTGVSPGQIHYFYIPKKKTPRRKARWPFNARLKRSAGGRCADRTTTNTNTAVGARPAAAAAVAEPKWRVAWRGRLDEETGAPRARPVSRRHGGGTA